MKKTLIALSFVCAGALAFADDEQYENWFSGIGTGATITEAAVDLKQTNGTWGGVTAENAEIEDGALMLDLGEAEEATFTVANTDSAKALGVFPAQGIVVRGVFTPIAAEDLLTGKAMAAKEAKVGFAIVNVGGETDTYKYYAWVGKESTAEDAAAIADWVDLGKADDVAVAKTIVIDLEYNSESVTAAFGVGAVDLEDLKAAKPLTSDDGLPLSGSASTRALKDKVIASVSCTGSGTLKELKGLYQYVVAEVNGTQYGTVEDAVVAAQPIGATVKLVREAKGAVTVAGGVTIDPNGKSAPTVKVDASDNSKEIAESATGVVTVQTKTSILNDIKFTVGSGEAATQKGLMKNEAKFRKFLDDHCGVAYRQANTTAKDIKTALEGMSSGRTLWQSYALGVEPDAALKLTQVAKDGETDWITLALPNVASSGDFVISYTVTDDTEAGTKTVTDATAVKVPLKTGHYKVKISFE